MTLITDDTNPEELSDNDKLILEYMTDGVLAIAQASGLDPELVYDLQFDRRNLEIIVTDNGDGTQNVHFEFGDRVAEGEAHEVSLTFKSHWADE